MPILLLIFAVVMIDQFSKYYIQSHMTLGMSLPVIPNIFHITYILNPGAAFGILEHQTIVFIIIALGIIGNVIDRIKTGYVIDFFDFRIWPVFNVADIAIVCGVALIIYSLLLSSEH